MIDDVTHKLISILLKCLAVVFVVFGIYAFGYQEGKQNTITKYESVIAESKVRAEIRYRDMLDAQNDELRKYLSKLSELESQHQADVEALKNAEFKDTVTVTAATHNTECDRVSDGKSSSSGMPKTKAQSDLLCYSREELQQKVARSLAITRDADELREKYQALIKICTD